MTGKLVVFEGGEGAGKGTQIRHLERHLDFGVLVTRQPGGTDLGAELRRVLLESAPGTVDDRTEALLYAADRAQHVAEVVEPALLLGRTVICDRWVDSSIAYQAAGRRMDRVWIEALSTWATAGIVPDLTILLDIDPLDGLDRAAHRGSADRLEREALDFHRRVRQAYLDLADANIGRYLVLDATKPEDELAATIARRVDTLLGTAPA
ncbi:dTMP kinase [Dactylosporangium sucinum]|nr:dTMP kinase [Dactylosporangium sucinum]